MRTLFESLTLTAVTFAAVLPLMAAPADIVEGNPTSPVKVFVYEDLQCPDCANFRAMMDEKVLPKYGKTVAFIHRDFPLAKHAWARPAAIAGRWIYEHDRDLGLVYRREIMAQQRTISADNLKAWLTEFATRNKLDPKAIVDSLTDQRLAALVDMEFQGGVGRGISHTPTVMVGNSASFVETIVFEDLSKALDEALGK